MALTWPLLDADRLSLTGLCWGLPHLNLDKQWVLEKAVRVRTAPKESKSVLWLMSRQAFVRVQLHQADFAEAWLSFPTGQ